MKGTGTAVQSTTSSPQPPSPLLSPTTAIDLGSRDVPSQAVCYAYQWGTTDVELNEFSDAVVMTDDKKNSKSAPRSLFRLTEGRKPSSNSWDFYAGSPDNRHRWIHLIKGTVPKTKDDGNDEVIHGLVLQRRGGRAFDDDFLLCLRQRPPISFANDPLCLRQRPAISFVNESLSAES